MSGLGRLFLGPLVLAAMLLAGMARPAGAQPLVADISNHLVGVTTGFAGTDLLLFGATEGLGKIAVVVRGPAQPVVVRRKERVLGVWLNREATVFADVPAFYAIATSEPLATIAAPAELARQELGLANLPLLPAGGVAADPDGGFRAALVRGKQRNGHFLELQGAVSFLGQRLFRVTIPLPATVPTGTFTATVYLLIDGEVVAAQTSPLVVSKLGAGARISSFAQSDAAMYGLFAITLALFAGWLGSVVFRQN